MSEGNTDRVYVEVLPAPGGDRQIRGGDKRVLELLEQRAADIRDAMTSGAQTVANGLRELTSPEGWQIGEVSAAFGVSLTAEGGMVITKAGVGATLEITVSFVRQVE
ncbi:hypothetical protein BWI15_01775 [Kribbella sp. ALI-6-A]|uniref:CU044_2847 family protein n=1 Tax=Kribbella sp. ALI-6-A TaxID=1933817 RepID=UPI00097C85B9|nr:CU044_2847 family protein [Kribbella sp. ALI-6-A]ONI78234.1 hypothetical protein BWI15_01775 [Kribbella sp. ALI-6-A]